MKVQRNPNFTIPVLVVSSLDVTAEQIFTEAREYGATSGSHAAINLLSENPAHAGWYSMDSLESVLRNRRADAADKSWRGQLITLRVGIKDARIEFTGIFETAECGYIVMKVNMTKYCHRDITLYHRKPFKVLVHRHKAVNIMRA